MFRTLTFLHSDKDLLPLASLAAHRVVSKARAASIFKDDFKEIRSSMLSVISCLLAIDEELVPPDIIQDLTGALDLCLLALEACSSVVSPAATLLLSGPLARRLRQHLSEVATGLETLCSRTTELSGSGLLAPSATLRGIILKVLDAREQRAAALAKSLGAHPGAGPAAAACVISALKAEGMTDSELRDPEARSALAAELFHLAGNEESWLQESEAERIVTVASVLLAAEVVDCEPEPPNTAFVKETCASLIPSSSTKLVIQKSFMCPITQQLMRDPVCTLSGHTYERKAIEGWLKMHDTDPTTREVLKEKVLTPNWTVKSAIDEWLGAARLSHDGFDRLTEEGTALIAHVRIGE